MPLLLRVLGPAVAVVALIAGWGVSPAAARPLSFERVSLSPSGEPFSGDDAHSFAPSVSADGSVVAFTHGVTAGPPDAGLYVRDRRSQRTELASVLPDGRPAIAWNLRGSLSADGRFAVFTWYESPVFVRDLERDETIQVPLGDGPDGQPLSYAETPSISADGRLVAFRGSSNGYAWHVFVADMARGTVRQVDPDVAGPSTVDVRLDRQFPVISADGSAVAFISTAALSPQDTNEASDVYVRDLRKDTLERISVDGGGREFSDGVYGGDDTSVRPALSADGNVVAFVRDEPVATAWNGHARQLWVRDRRAGTSVRLSSTAAGRPGSWDAGQPAVSADGRWIAFQTEADELLDAGSGHRIVVADRVCRTLSAADLSFDAANWTREPALTADGAMIAYTVYDWGSPLPDDTNGQADVVLARLSPPSADCAAPRSYGDVIVADAPAGFWRLEGSPVLRDEVGVESGTVRGHYWMVEGVDRDRGDRGVTLNLLSRGDRAWLDLGPGFAFPDRRPFSLEIWLRPRMLDDQTSRLFSKEDAHGGYLLGASAAGIAFSRTAGGRSTTIRAPLGHAGWTHVVATYDGTRMSLYLDGKLAAHGTSGLQLPAPTAPLAVGAKQGRWRFLAGDVDDPAVYGRALTAADVARHFEALTVAS